MIRLLVADDAAVMRQFLHDTFAAEGDFVVACCRDGDEVRRSLHGFRPDVVTLDIDMPGDGLAVLSHIMAERPCPVVMCSALTVRGAVASLEALARGAVDYVAKPTGGDLAALRAMLVAKVRQAAAAHLLTQWPVVPQRRPSPAALAGERVVLVGVSTGGPRTLEQILARLPADFPWPIVVAQHMPAQFTAAFAERLGQHCRLPVVEASGVTALLRGRVHIARGGADLQLVRRGAGLALQSRPESDRYAWHPSVDLLVASALQLLPASQLVGVLLTGMGDDGAAEMKRLHDQGGTTIAESAETAVVYGMPRALVQLQGAGLQLPAWAIADTLAELAGQRQSAPTQPD